MDKEFLTEESVKNKLGIKDFRSISKNQLIEFVSNIPNMDKEVAIKCVEQFPSFSEFGNTALTHYYDLCNNVLNNVHKTTIESYQLILDDLHNQLDKDEYTLEEKRQIISTMIEVGEKIENVEDEKTDFAQSIIKYASTLAAIVVTSGAALLGVKINKK